MIPDASLARGLVRQDARAREKAAAQFSPRMSAFLAAAVKPLMNGCRLTPRGVHAAIERAEVAAAALSPLFVDRTDLAPTPGRPKAAASMLSVTYFEPHGSGNQRIVMARFNVERRRWSLDVCQISIILYEHAFERALQRGRLSAAEFGKEIVSALLLLPRAVLPVAGGLLLGDLNADVGSVRHHFGVERGRPFDDWYTSKAPVLIAKTYIDRDCLSQQQERQHDALAAELQALAAAITEPEE